MDTSENSNAKADIMDQYSLVDPISADWQSGKNPLLNPVIIDQIVKLMKPDFEQMKKLRLVSKIWTETTQQYWRKSCAALVINPDPVRSIRNPKPRKGLTISEVLTELQNFQNPFPLFNKPFSKYSLKKFTFGFQFWSNHIGQEALFRTAVGPNMENLHLNKCYFHNSFNSVTCPLVQLLNAMTPNLKSLTLTDVEKLRDKPVYEIESEDDSDSNGDHNIDAEGNFQNFNVSLYKLKTLTVYFNNDDFISLRKLLELAPELEMIIGQDNEQRRLLKTISEVRLGRMSDKIKPLSKLACIDLINSKTCSSYFATRFWSSMIPPTESLQKTQLPLQMLALNLNEASVAWDLNTYISSFFRTLKIFKAFRMPVVQLGRPYTDFLSNVSMLSLQEICLSGTIAPSLGFLINTPNLHKLKISLSCFEKHIMVGNALGNPKNKLHKHWKYQKYQTDLASNVEKNLSDTILCTRLEHFEIDYEFPENSLKLLEKWMPNLKILKTILNKFTVQIICEAWQNLTELVCLHESKLDNNSFIPDENAGGSFRKICDLRDLERFQFDSYCSESELTDDVIFKGLMKMANLNSVVISVNSKVSIDAETALRETTTYCKIIRSYGQGFNGAQSCQCKRCMFRRFTENEEVTSSEESDEDRYGMSFDY